MKTNLYTQTRSKVLWLCTMLCFSLLFSIAAIGQCTWYVDTDGDTYGYAGNSINAPCSPQPQGYVANNTDCDDGNPAAHPGATEVCDLADNDCNNQFDEGFPTTLFYYDNDGDGFGDGAILPYLLCGPIGYFTALQAGDCDDTQALYQDADGDGFGTIFVLVACNGVTNSDDCSDAQVLYQDNDGDGFGSNIMVACGGVLNNLDFDDNLLLYVDNDVDGFGSTVFSASVGSFNNLDCNDNLALYDDFDEDGFGSNTRVPCIGVTNNLDCDDSPFGLTYADNDGDGWGFGALVPCGVDNNLDCDDNFRSYEDNDGDGFGYPSGPLPCGGVFNNIDCNDFAILYPDVDGDGFGFGIPIPCNGVTNHDDCNDNSAATHPGAIELFCDGIDNDCNGVIDAGAPALTVDAGPNKIVYRGYADSSCTRLQSSNVGGGVGPLTLTWTPGNSHQPFINVCPTTTRVYYLTVTDANGCTKTDSVKVCVIDVRCGNNLKSVTICHGTGSASNPYTTLCVGKTETNSHFLNHPGEQLGPCGLVKTCNFPVGERLDNSGEETINGDDIYIGAFPNPFSNTTTIRFMLPENDFVSVKVFDVAGREMETLFEGATGAGNVYEVTLDASRFTNGMYFLGLNTRNGANQVTKLILSK